MEIRHNKTIATVSPDLGIEHNDRRLRYSGLFDSLLAEHLARYISGIPSRKDLYIGSSDFTVRSQRGSLIYLARTEKEINLLRNRTNLFFSTYELNQNKPKISSDIWSFLITPMQSPRAITIQPAKSYGTIDKLCKIKRKGETISWERNDYHLITIRNKLFRINCRRQDISRDDVNLKVMWLSPEERVKYARRLARKDPKAALRRLHSALYPKGK